MYSVIILNKRSSDLLKNYHFLFKPYIDAGEIGICNWNESGTDIASSVPDLYKLVKGKKEWRAVIVNTDSLFGYDNSIVPDVKNPFDYSKTDQEVAPHESPVPIIRLSHMLCGYSNVIQKQYEKGFQYEEYSAEAGCRVPVKVKAAELTDEDIQALADNHEDLKDIFIEKDIPEEYKVAAEALSKKYHFAETRPEKIALISTRTDFAGDEARMVIESWKDHLEMTSSLFCERNHYPSVCRFMCFDFTNSDNSLFDKQLLEFWMSVLTLCLNKIAASYLQAYRLYRIDVGIDNDSFSKSINGHLDGLMAAKRYVEKQLSLKPELSFNINEEIVKKEDIPCSVESTSTSNLIVSRAKIGFATDKPTNEFAYWNDEERDKHKNLETYLKGPRRAINVSANLLRTISDSYKEKTYVLDEFQIDDVNESKYEYEKKILANDIGNTLDKKKMMEELDEKSKKIRKIISYRMRFSTIVIISVIVIFLILLGCIPYIVYGFKSTHKIMPFIEITSLMTLLSLLGGVVVLFIQRNRLRSAINDFNNVMRKIIAKINTYASDFSKYFSDVCTYMKAKSIVKNVQTNSVAYNDKLSMLKLHENAIDEAISKDLGWVSAFDVKRKSEYIDNVTGIFDPHIRPSDSKIYYVAVSEDDTEIQVNESGYYIHTPYDFVSHFILEREDLYDELEEGTNE